MENKKRTKEEIIADRNGFLWLLIPFVILFLSGIFIMGYIKGMVGSIAGGFCAGCSGALMFALGVGIGGCNEELRQLKVKESKQRLDDALESYNKMGEKIMELRTEMEIYDNLRCREDVLRDKFGGITHKELRKDFLEFECFPGVQVKDIINLIIRFKFKYKDEYRRALMMFQEKQAILNMYKEKPKKVGKRNVKN